MLGKIRDMVDEGWPGVREPCVAATELVVIE